MMIASNPLNLIAGSALKQRITFSGRQYQAPELFFGKKQEETIFNPWIQIGKDGEVYTPKDKEWYSPVSMPKTGLNYLA
jgi:hypothetical protein